MRPIIGMLAAAIVLVSGSVEAQDLNGFYAGLHAGYSVVKPEFTEPVFESATVNPTVNGMTSGTLFGYRRGRVGFEAEIGIANVGATEMAEGGGFTQFEADWVSRARVTLSHTAGNTLVFAAAGISAMRLFVDDAYVDPTADDPLQHDPSLSTLKGWTIGGGLERQVRERISARVEAIYDRFAGRDLSANPGEGRVEPASTTIRFGILFKF